MTMPALQVLMGFPAVAALSNVFQLDSGHGILDTNTLGTLNQLANAVDVTAATSTLPFGALTGKLDITRGKSRETDQYQAGSLAFELRNEDRRFDPLNTASPYYPGIVPRTPVQAWLAGVQIFGGVVDDYGPAYVKPSFATLSVSCLDGFTHLANTYLRSYVPPVELSGQRIVDVLKRPEVAYPYPSNIQGGFASLLNTTYDQIAALDHLHVVENSENGELFVDRTGALQFWYRYGVGDVWVQNPQGVMTFTDAGVGLGSGPVLGYMDVGMLSEALILYNQVKGQRTGGAVQYTDDLASQALYGLRQLALPALAMSTDADALAVMKVKLQRYGKPEVRFDALRLELTGLTTAQQAQVAALDIGQPIAVVRTPPGGGSPISLLCFIERMAWSLDVSSSSATLDLGLRTLGNVGASPWLAPIFLDRPTSTLDVNALN